MSLSCRSLFAIAIIACLVVCVGCGATAAKSGGGGGGGGTRNASCSQIGTGQGAA